MQSDGHKYKACRVVGVYLEVIPAKLTAIQLSEKFDADNSKKANEQGSCVEGKKGKFNVKDSRPNAKSLARVGTIK